MTIYTKAAYTTKEGICEGGLERTNELLTKLGLDMNSRVSMQLIMRELGLSDTLFSFCKVCKGCEAEADSVLHRYMATVTGLACRWLVLTMDYDAQQLILAANIALNKRFMGIVRKPLWEAHYKLIKKLQEKETLPQNKYWLGVYLCMLADKPDHLCATHGSIALMDGAGVAGIREEVHQRLCDELNSLLGEEI